MRVRSSVLQSLLRAIHMYYFSRNNFGKKSIQISAHSDPKMTQKGKISNLKAIHLERMRQGNNVCWKKLAVSSLRFLSYDDIAFCDAEAKKKFKAFPLPGGYTIIRNDLPDFLVVVIAVDVEVEWLLPHSRHVVAC